MTSNGVIIQSYYNDKQKLFKYNSKSSLLPIGPTDSPGFLVEHHVLGFLVFSIVQTWSVEDEITR